jgi:aldose 1-epimerase
MAVSKGEPFGATPDGLAAEVYTIANAQLRARITDFGGRLVSLEMQDDDEFVHVNLGFDDVADYAANGGSFGALLGRTSNRIAGGAFMLDGQRYELTRNEGRNTLHGGGVFGKLLWRVLDADETHVVLEHVSAAGDQGFPGELTVRATWRLDGATLWLEYEAETTAPTPVSLSAHPYFNLRGVENGDVLDYEYTIAAEEFLPTDDEQIPTGERRGVDNTPFDFREPRTAAARIREPNPQLINGKGYDHYFILDSSSGDGPRFAARVRDPVSGRTLEVHTTQPGLQFYTANNLVGTFAGRGGIYRQSCSFAFEPQGFPNAPNVEDFPSVILRPGETYRQRTGYRLSIGSRDTSN